ncbi:hypothetical protein B0H11DRAFT_2434281 [Mycena galericulata]|nr:hypothetical protein B0H11DRAFT_2434281 [Mycena galericulata]
MDVYNRALRRDQLNMIPREQPVRTKDQPSKARPLPKIESVTPRRRLLRRLFRTPQRRLGKQIKRVDFFPSVVISIMVVFVGILSREKDNLGESGRYVSKRSVERGADGNISRVNLKSNCTREAAQSSTKSIVFDKTSLMVMRRWRTSKLDNRSFWSVFPGCGVDKIVKKDFTLGTRSPTSSTDLMDGAWMHKRIVCVRIGLHSEFVPARRVKVDSWESRWATGTKVDDFAIQYIAASDCPASDSTSAFTCRAKLGLLWRIAHRRSQRVEMKGFRFFWEHVSDLRLPA